MCHFVTLIVPAHDEEDVRGVMERHGRAARPIDNPSIRKLLRAGERQYLTTRGHCDCGTVLAPRHRSAETFEQRLASQAARLRRQGWSESKIARAIEDRRRAEARPDRAGVDSLELWNDVLHDLREELGLPYAALFVHFYSGEIETEAFDASRREVPQAEWQEGLSSLQDDEVTVFRFA